MSADVVDELVGHPRAARDPAIPPRRSPPPITLRTLALIMRNA
jgi:hypothetical protein